MATTSTTTTTSSDTQWDYDPYGASGSGVIAGGAGNDRLFGGAGSDVMDGGDGSDDLKGGSGNDTFIYTLSQNTNSSKDVYTGGSGIDTVVLQLSEAEWTSPAVRAELQRYVTFLGVVKKNVQGEVSSGLASDFVFDFGNGTTLTVQMMERLVVAVKNATGPGYTVVNHLTALITGDSSGGVIEAGGIANAMPGMPAASGNLDADDLDGPDDAFVAVAAGAATVGGFGSYGVTAAGVWTYTLNNNLAAVNALAAGATLNDTFSVSTVDGATKVVTVTITGSNDGPVVAADDVTGGVTEQVDPAGNITDTGTIAFSDVDLADVHSVGAVTASLGALGSLSAAVTTDTTGSGTGGVVTWSYSVPASAVEHLAQGQTKVETFSFSLGDGQGGSVTRTVTVTITGSNDGPIVAADDVTGGVTEQVDPAGNITDTGTISFSDVDLADVHGVGAVTASLGALGSLTASVTTDTTGSGTGGVVTWNYSVPASAVEYLAQGQTQVETFTFSVSDGNGGNVSRTVTLTITGTNDVATISGDADGDVTEDESNPTITETGTLSVADVDAGQNVFNTSVTDTTPGGALGTLSITAAGVWTYTVANAAVQYLGAGVTKVETFQVASVDGTDTQVVTITITGTNDLATISGDASGDTTEDESTPTITETGSLSVADADAGEDVFNTSVADTTAGGALGNLSITAAGAWTYTVANSAVQYLGAGVTKVETFQVASVDGTDTQTISVTITGTNDLATISGDADGDVTEDASTPTITETGSLSVADADAGEDVFNTTVTDTTAGGALGSLSITAAGAWTYTVANSAVQYLGAGVTKVETFQVASVDGTDTQVVTITITGTNDLATISGDASGDAAEDESNPTITETGTLSVADADAGEDVFNTTVTDTTAGGALGSLSITAAGAWTYTVANAAVQHLGAGVTKVETFQVASFDGTDTQVVTITITGTNDLATISGDASGEATEDESNPTITETGTLSVADADAGEDVLNTTVTDTTAGGALGSLSITAAGVWTYTVANAAVQYLGTGVSKVETFQVASLDGTDTQVVMITITGTNDGPIVAADDVTGGVTEQGSPAGNIIDSGTIAFSDVDLPDVHSVGAVTASLGALGSLTASVTTDTTGSGAGGVVSWSYSVLASAVEYLAQGQTKVETFTFTLSDGQGVSVARTVSVTITGTNDAPLVSATDVTGAVTEQVTPAGNLSDSGSITFTDVDLNDVHLVSASGTPIGSVLGSLSAVKDTDTTGTGSGGQLTWTYTVAASAVEYLAAGQTRLESFTLTLDDQNGSVITKQIDVTITGTNDAPVISIIVGADDGDAASLSETNAPLTASDTLTVRDSDDANTVTSSVTSVTAAGTYGGGSTPSNAALLAMMNVTAGALAANSTDTSNLTWSFNSTPQAFNFLAAGETLVLTYVITSTDGSASDTEDVVVTITGANDAAIDLIFTVTSNSGNSLPNNAFGQFSVSDPDGGALSYNYSLASLTATRLDGSSASNFAGDLTVSSAGIVSASNLDDDRIYEMTVDVTQSGTGIFSEIFSIVTGTNAGNNINGIYVSGDDVIFARGAADTILAGSGDDSVFGQADADHIHGGTGNDTLNGGNGNDSFYFDTTLSASTNVDTITDFAANTADKIILDQTIFTSLAVGTLASANFLANSTGDAGDANDYVIHETDTGNLYYDFDGNGAGQKVIFATLTLAGISGTVDSADFTVIL